MLRRLEPVQRTMVLLFGLVATMGTLAFASVPLYDWFCRVTGYGGTTLEADAGSDVILDRTINVRFDGSTAKGMGWNFKPSEREMTIRIGETGLAFYTAHNPTDKPIAGSASYNVFPFTAGGFFTKIDCFCFEEQVLQPGETVEMPVTFYVDPDIATDRDGKHISEITLSYTFYEIEMPELAQVAPDQAQQTNLN